MRVFQEVIQGIIDQNSKIHTSSGHRIKLNISISDWDVMAHLFSKHFGRNKELQSVVLKWKDTYDLVFSCKKRALKI